MPPRRNNSNSSKNSTNQASTSDSTDDLLQEILQRLRTIDSKIDNLESKVSDVENSLTYHIELVEELKEDVRQIKTVVPVLESKVNNQENVTISKTLEIQGIPYHSNEKAIDIVTCIAEKIDVEITKDNIDSVYRNKSKKSIIVRFLQTHVRDSFFSSYRNLSAMLKGSDLGFEKNNEKIYVNEYLLYETRNLFFQAREFKKKHSYKFVWTRNQHVFLRKTEDSSTINVKCSNDLSNLLKK